MISTGYLRKSGYEAVQLDEDWIIIDTECLTVTRLNETGWRCWTLLEQVHTAGSLTEALRQEYLDAGNSVDSDIEQFLAELSDCGLLVHVGV